METKVMTVKEKLVGMLVDCGMFDEQAEEIFKLAVPALNMAANPGAKEVEARYNIPFDRPWTEYPTVLYGMWFDVIKPIALKWIDENKPQAWFREMFV